MNGHDNLDDYEKHRKAAQEISTTVYNDLGKLLEDLQVNLLSKGFPVGVVINIVTDIIIKLTAGIFTAIASKNGGLPVEEGLPVAQEHTCKFVCKLLTEHLGHKEGVIVIDLVEEKRQREEEERKEGKRKRW